MNKLLLLAVGTLFYVHFGEGHELKCIKCKYNVGSISCMETKETCHFGHVCGTITEHANHTKIYTEKKCVHRAKCDRNETVIRGPTNYTTSTVCCDQMFCNV